MTLDSLRLYKQYFITQLEVVSWFAQC